MLYLISRLLTNNNLDNYIACHWLTVSQSALINSTYEHDGDF